MIRANSDGVAGPLRYHCMLRQTNPVFAANVCAQDDVHRFHVLHFPTDHVPKGYPHGTHTEAVDDYEDYDDDGLGYYEDGVKRTLTDEQIAIFRHTEIQTILRERRQRLEAGEPSNSPPPSNAPSQVSDTSLNPEPSVPTHTSDQDTPMSISSDSANEQSDTTTKPQQQWTAVSARTKAKNARRRKKNRKNWRAKKREKQERELRDEEESDEWDPWHQANGPDAQKDDTVELEY